MMPADQPQSPDERPFLVPPLQPPAAPRYRWYHKLGAVLSAVLLFEMGVFLIVFPWASEWELNWFSSLPYWTNGLWYSPYFRGAISGLGVLNIWLSFIEVFRLRRFSER
jgi:hypothetical protein